MGYVCNLCDLLSENCICTKRELSEHADEMYTKPDVEQITSNGYEYTAYMYEQQRDKARAWAKLWKRCAKKQYDKAVMFKGYFFNMDKERLTVTVERNTAEQRATAAGAELERVKGDCREMARTVDNMDEVARRMIKHEPVKTENWERQFTNGLAKASAILKGGE